MKKIYSYLIILTAALFFNACADSEYTEIYSKPSEISTASVDKMMTGVFYTGRTYTFNAYWRVWTWDNNLLGKYAQTISTTSDNGQVYSGTNGESYAKDRWEAFYNTLTQYRILEDIYNKLGEEEKQANNIFKELAEVFLYDHLAQVVDTWGDIPFSKAGTLYLTGNAKESYPTYDKATAIYETMIDRLGIIATNIAATTAPTSLVKQDFINDGNLDKWERYANSLRLRLAIRVAVNGPLVTKAKAAIAEILNGNKKLVNSYETLIALPANNDDTANFFNPDDLRTGYNENTTYSNASAPMLKALNAGTASPDPRLPFLYSKNAAGNYAGIDRALDDYATITTNIEKVPAERAYSRIDSTTVGYNTQFISPILTAAEVSFLQAEAYQQGWATGDAKAAFVAGIKHAAEFVFELNKLSPSKHGYKPEADAYPTLTEVEAYASSLWEGAPDKQKEIIRQRWLNYGFFQAQQAWCEVRRVGYTYLGFNYLTDATAQVMKEVPNRIKYPATERSYNTANYNTQIESMPNGDDYYTKLFWAK